MCEFESDKATLEYPAEVAGVITLVAKAGDDLPIGAVIAIIVGILLFILLLAFLLKRRK